MVIDAQRVEPGLVEKLKKYLVRVCFLCYSIATTMLNILSVQYAGDRVALYDDRDARALLNIYVC